jgi:hypothetical protein
MMSGASLSGGGIRILLLRCTFTVVSSLVLAQG